MLHDSDSIGVRYRVDLDYLRPARTLNRQCEVAVGNPITKILKGHARCVRISDL